MWVLIRAVTYATFFIGFLLVFVPVRLLVWSGVREPTVFGIWQIAGTIIAAAGAAMMTSCILTFVFVGKGTPAPFDPPRRLVIRGPYRLVRNPMYLGAAISLAGAAVFYKSIPLVAYAAVFVLITHLFVLFYEEPALRRTFGGDYDSYCRRVGRWWPRR